MPRCALIPDAFAASLRGRPPEPPDSRTPGVDGDTWLIRLPQLFDEALRRWDLRVDHEEQSRHGLCALVVPVRRADGEPAAVKISWPHPESRHEHLALRAWAGDGAVRLLAAHPADEAQLLERLDPDRDLSAEPIERACTVIGRLLRRLDRPALPQLDSLAVWTQAFVDASLDRGSRLPRRFVEQARSLATDLLADGTNEPLDTRLVHTDLHYANVLASPDRSDAPVWVAIDPKPMAAEPAFAVWPALHNRWDEALDGDLSWNIRCRLGWICEAADIDEERARAWAIVRTAADDRLLTTPTAGSGGLLSARVRLLKALQPHA